MSMTPARLQTIKEIFHAALDCEPDQLNAFLDETCAGDEVLHANVEALLASHRQAGNFIETPVASLAASIVKNGRADVLMGQMIGHYKISKRIGAAGWVKCISLLTLAPAERPRSNSCPRSLAAMRSV